MKRQYKDSASREQSQACLNSAEAQPVFERKFKDSGIEWIGKIPETWEVKRLKNLCTSQGSLIADGDWIESPDISDFGIRYYTTGNIGDGTFKKQGKSFVTEETFQRLNCTPVFPGDLVFSRLNNPIGRSCIIPNDYPICVVAVDNVIVRPNSEYDKRYLVYITMCPGYQETNILIARGTTMQRMSRTQLQNVDMPIPPIHEQKRIADYLDGKCGEIDSLIALQEQMIEKLKAYKQSVITEAVTKGLNPNAKLVPSGIDWIEEIPIGWKVCRIKDLVNMKSGSNLTSEDIANEGLYPVYGGNGLRGYYNEYSNEGDYVLVGRQGALCGNINYAYGRFWATDHAVVCYPKRKFAITWFGETLRSMNLGQYSLSAAQPGLSVERIKEKWMPLPPLSEQQAIAAYLDEKCADIDCLIALKQQKIEKLKDYKKSVIYEAVTGKTTIE